MTTTAHPPPRRYHEIEILTYRMTRRRWGIHRHPAGWTILNIGRWSATIWHQATDRLGR